MDDAEGLQLTPREKTALERNPSATIVGAAIAPPTEPELHGVGGWLFFLALSLTVLGPLLTLSLTGSQVVQLEAQYPDAVGSPEWSFMLLYSWGFALTYCAISIFAGYRLFSHLVSQTIPIVIGCLWAAGPLLGLIDLVVSQGDAQAAAEFVRSIISVSIWTAYLLKSRRVRNTYRSSPVDQSVVEAFR